MTRDSFLNRINKPKPTASHLRSRVQERELAKKVGGKLTPNSGAGAVKGDVRKKKIVRIEAKTTKNASFSVTEDMIHKIEEAALSTGEMPVIVVEICNGDPRRRRTVVVCPSYALDMIGTIDE